MNRPSHCACARPMVPVRDATDIDFLVKESEIVTGVAGRTFVVLGARNCAYRIELVPCGYLLDPLDDGGAGTGAQLVTAADWPLHAVARALRAGLVFTVEAGR
ncbi:hypothetical protein DelCs14_1711 [Delftia sp. Cs1-4]|uniref:hypothetical protein n=1 Tax=Delftia sp. (strain Cs1-4) TaxID=742013 RepID=UPI00020E7A80|nr:hypothetical protein [Delftia sp. Cs1-4]AEF88740.1 hypothetical protein DelCs14_1711 [Delftia sp. Cs1-4]